MIPVILKSLKGTCPYHPDTQASWHFTSRGRSFDGVQKSPAFSIYPVVEMWDLTPSPLDSVVGFNQVRSGQKGADFLLENGDRKIGLGTAEDARAATWQQATQETFIKYGVTDITVAKVPEPSSMELGRLGTTQLLKKWFFR